MNRLAKKTISFIIPCYNSAEYMDNCIQSLVNLNCDKDDIEIIIVDDGSQIDNTLQKAIDWQKKYPSIIQVIHQENGGHGQAINTGLSRASGLYFKVVDSDDYLDYKATIPTMDYLRKQVTREENEEQATDLILTNFVYNKVIANKLHPIAYDNIFPQNREFSWNDIKTFYPWQTLKMHSAIYKTQILRDINLQLPKYLFYVDVIFLTIPLPYVKTIYYINTNMYMYYIGRPDQSVNEKVIMSRYKQMIDVVKITINELNIKEVQKYPKLEKYIYHFLASVILVCTIIVRIINTNETNKALKDMWNYIKEYDIDLYRSITKQLITRLSNISGEFGRQLCVIGYKISKILIPYTSE